MADVAKKHNHKGKHAKVVPGDRGKPKKGETKKGGAGGKFTWGKVGDEHLGADLPLDRADPNFDDGEPAERFSLYVRSVTVDEERMLAKLEDILNEYFVNGDPAVVAAELDELTQSVPAPRVEIVSLILRKSLDKGDAERELASELIPFLLVAHHLRYEDVSTGFVNVLHSLADIKLDTPKAVSLLGKFGARLVADDCLAPSVINPDRTSDPDIHDALKQAKVLIEAPHGLPRADVIWNTSGKFDKPLQEIVSKMVDAINEFLVSNDIAEVARCLRELEVPHFLHEFVYEATLVALTHGHSSVQFGQLHALIRQLAAENTLPPRQVATGFHRIVTDLADITLDIPKARGELVAFLNPDLSKVLSAADAAKIAA